MTIREALRAIRAEGCTASWRSEYREFRVSLPGLPPAEAEQAAYYTNDPQDAIDTAKVMRQWTVPGRLSRNALQ